MTRVPNALIHSASPYLLQHAYNPVQWFPWGEEALRKAREENKLIIISIGYSACHWCHVMEKESFEDEEVATVMNKSFVCIKVDREERPDIDQVYMDAVQLMTGRGGWPLNIIALPDQRPLYGGTYFPKEQWRQVLLQLAAFFRNDPGKCHEYAEELTSGVQKLGRLIPVNDDGNRGMPSHPAMIQEWAKQWDREEGGPLRAPKFPMPDGYRYLLAAATQLKLDEAEEQVHLTLHKMAHGGIYDQLGGGFSRYSTDLLWKVPHFEKMLYDNALLVSLYADAFKRRPLPLYREVITGTLDFVSREMTSPGGGFYSALDADTEGVEGKFYCWNIDELRALLGEEAELAQDYFSINEKGYWEHDRYILLRNDNEEELALRHRSGIEEFRQRIHVIKQKMFAAREERVRPGLDDKILCSWNAMMMTAFLDAWAALGDPSLLDAAQKSADFIRRCFMTADGTLLHSVKETAGVVTSGIPGFLEDYAFTIEAFLRHYSLSMDPDSLQTAERLTAEVLRNFSDEETGMFWFTAAGSETLIARKMEVQDNVIPSSNAVMAHNLLRLSKLKADASLENRCKKMLRMVKEDTIRNTPWYSRWAMVWLELEHGTEVAVSGREALHFLNELQKEYLPLSVFAGATGPSRIPLLAGRYHENETGIYVCRYGTCHVPVYDLASALSNLRG